MNRNQSGKYAIVCGRPFTLSKVHNEGGGAGGGGGTCGQRFLITHKYLLGVPHMCKNEQPYLFESESCLIIQQKFE